MNLWLHEPGEARRVDLCGCHIKPFKLQRRTAVWTVTNLVRVVYS